jgi:hypothetical protein
MSEDNSITFYTTILSGGLFAISELLPYISKVKGNGIIQVLLNSFSKYDESRKEEEKKEKERIENQTALLNEILQKLEMLQNAIKPQNN